MTMLTKEEKEKRIFDAFVAIEPNFAGEKVICCRGQEPPDFLCTVEGNREIGIELVEWLHHSQTTRSSSLKNLERKIQKTNPPNAVINLINRNDIILSPKGFPSKAYLNKFINELFDCLTKITHNIMGDEQIINFDNYSTLNKYLNNILISPSRFTGGVSFIMGGDYSPNYALDALCEIIEKKLNKKDYPALRRKLSELYLIIYYSNASYLNSPFIPQYDEQSIVLFARKRLTNINNLFDKIFLFFGLEPKMEVFSLYP